MDICFEKRQADLPQGSIHIGYREFATPPQLIEYLRKSSAECLEHFIPQLKKQLPEGRSILADKQEQVKENGQALLATPILTPPGYSAGDSCNNACIFFGSPYNSDWESFQIEIMGGIGLSTPDKEEEMKKSSILFMCGMFTCALIAGLFLLGSPASAQESDEWQTLPLPDGVALYQIVFLDDSIGWATGENADGQETLFRTADGGQNWEERPLGMADVRFYSLAWVDSTTGYISGRSRTTDQPLLLRTTDGGQSWQAIAVPNLNGAISGLFVQPGGGLWVEIFDHEMRKVQFWYSPDGETWSDRTSSLPQGATISQFFFPDARTGYAVGKAGDGNDVPLVLKSADGGETWTEQALPLAEGSLEGVYFFDALTGFLCGGSGEFGVILKTDDGGETWTEAARLSGSTLSFYQIIFNDQQVGFLSGWWTADNDYGARIYQTTDGGNTWTNLPLPNRRKVASLAATRDRVYAAIFDESGKFTLLYKPISPSPKTPNPTLAPTMESHPASPVPISSSEVTLSIMPQDVVAEVKVPIHFTAIAKDKDGNALSPANPKWSCSGGIMLSCSGYSCTFVFAAPGAYTVTVEDYDKQATANVSISTSYCECSASPLPIEYSLGFLALTFGAVYMIHHRITPTK